MANITVENVTTWFTFHPVADGTQKEAYEEIRGHGRVFAMRILELVPDGVEKEKAVAALREAVMWANAGVACNAGPQQPSSEDPEDEVQAHGYAPGGIHGLQVGHDNRQANTFR